MAGSKESPRQRMIGMMYLVLTALLALNVSKEILNAFVVINDSLDQTNSIIESKNRATMAQFEQQMAFDAEKTRPFYTLANQVTDASEKLDVHIDGLKRHLIQRTEGYDETVPDSMYSLRWVDGKDNVDIPTEILIGSEPAFPIETAYSAFELQQLITGFRDEITAIFDAEKDAELIREIEEGLAMHEVPKPEGGTETWINGNFYNMPLAACVTNLSKIQADIKNAEADALRALFRNIRMNDFKFDTIEAKVIPQSSYVMLGEEYKADVFLAAYSRTEQPEMLLGNRNEANEFLAQDSLNVENGLGQISLKASSTGFKTYDGMIKLKKEDGTYEDFPFQSEYIVAEPSLTVAPTQMNVFYKGINNPVEISVPGVANENLNVSITGGNRIQRTGNGAYKVNMSNASPRNIEVVVTATMPNGEQRTMGRKPFRVKQLPKPYAKIGEVETRGQLTNNELISKQGIRALYAADFPFNLQVSVDAFKVDFRYQGNYVTLASNNNRWTSRMKTSFQALPAGTQVTFYDIKATGSDGIPHKMGPIVVLIK